MSADESQSLGLSDILTLLAKGEMELLGMLPWSSNYTLLSSVTHNGVQGLGVYKPRRGERPLWDFTEGTLCQRETAAYLLSSLLGWQLVPPTVLRDGPYGLGSLQLFIDANHEEHLFTMQQEGIYDDQLRRLAAFDIVANNADRKSGHCLKGSDGRLWAIDHGICFHTEYKLRTVLWEFAGEALPTEVAEALRTLRARLDRGDYETRIFQSLLAADELQALRRRLDRLLERGHYPDPGGRRHMPWPPI